MANISKINQKLTQFGPAPQRTDPANFPTRANAMVTHFLTHLDEQNIMSDEYNTTIDEINTRAAEIDGKYDEIVEKHTDFIPKYNDAVKRHGQIVTMHEEVEADTSHVDTQRKEIDAIKTHIDERKTQIDTDLATAKSLINDGNGGIIDDKKTSAVSTWSSEELKRRFDLKADEATAYKEWNYKTITGDYTAKDNDALFIEASSSFEIQLPAKGKVRIIDKSGNFATHNIRLVSGGDKFVLNKNFQRVELFFFDGKWQVVNGTLLVEKAAYSVSYSEIRATSSIGLSAQVWFSHEGYLYAMNSTSPGSIIAKVMDLRTMENILPSNPYLQSGFTWKGAVFANNQLFLVANNKGNLKLFKFVVSTKSFLELNVALSFASSEQFAAIEPQDSKYLTMKSNKYIYISSLNNGQKTFHAIDTQGRLVRSHVCRGERIVFIADDILFEIEQFFDGGIIHSCRNMKNGNIISLGGEQTTNTNRALVDYKTNKFFFALTQPRKIIEWSAGVEPKIVTVGGGGPLPQTDVTVDEITLSKQNGRITKKDGSSVWIEYEAYVGNRKITKKEVLSSIGDDVFYSSTPTFTSDSKDIILSRSKDKILQINYTPTIFQEEI